MNLKTKTMIKSIISDYYEGNIQLEDALVIMEEQKNKLEEEINFYKEFKQELSEEISSLKNEFPDGYKGYSFEVRNGRTMYSFENIKEWLDVDNQKKEIEKRYKAIFKAKSKGIEFADIDKNGEQLDLPTVTYGKQSVIIKKN